MGQLIDFSTATVEQVLAIQAKALSFYAEGKTQMTWGVGENTAGNVFPSPIADVLRSAAYWLQVKDPDTFGRRITRTKADFS